MGASASVGFDMHHRVSEGIRPLIAAEGGVMQSLLCACELAGKGISGKAAQLFRWQAHSS